MAVKESGTVSAKGLPMPAADAEILKKDIPPTVSDIDVSTYSS